MAEQNLSSKKQPVRNVYKLISNRKPMYSRTKEKNGKEVADTPINFTGGIFITANPDIQEYMDNHKDNGKIFKRVKSEPVLKKSPGPAPTPPKEKTDEELDQVTVKNLNEANELLQDKGVTSKKRSWADVATAGREVGLLIKRENAET